MNDDRSYDKKRCYRGDPDKIEANSKEPGTHSSQTFRTLILQSRYTEFKNAELMEMRAQQLNSSPR